MRVLLANRLKNVRTFLVDRILLADYYSEIEVFEDVRKAVVGVREKYYDVAILGDRFDYGKKVVSSARIVKQIGEDRPMVPIWIWAYNRDFMESMKDAGASRFYSSGLIEEIKRFEEDIRKVASADIQERRGSKVKSLSG